MISLSRPEELDVTDDRVVYATENNSTFLECVPRSPQASVTWLVQRDDRKEEVRKGMKIKIINCHCNIFIMGGRWRSFGKQMRRGMKPE